MSVVFGTQRSVLTQLLVRLGLFLLGNLVLLGTWWVLFGWIMILSMLIPGSSEYDDLNPNVPQHYIPALLLICANFVVYVVQFFRSPNRIPIPWLTAGINLALAVLSGGLLTLTGLIAQLLPIGPWVPLLASGLLLAALPFAQLWLPIYPE